MWMQFDLDCIFKDYSSNMFTIHVFVPHHLSTSYLGMGWYHAVQMLGNECPSAKLCHIVEPWFLGPGK